MTALDDGWQDDVTQRAFRLPLVLALTCLVVADLLLWSISLGLGLVVWVLIVAAAIQILLWDVTQRVRVAQAWALLLLGLLPLIDLVQVPSVIIALAALLGFALIQTLQSPDVPKVLRAMLRLPGLAPLQTLRDLFTLRIPAPDTGGLRDWIVPIGIGSVFIALMGMANPIVDGWLMALSRFDPGAFFGPERMLFWGLLALAIWPLLRLRAMATALAQPAKLRLPLLRIGLLTPRAILRALVVFNLIFAVQSATDLGYLWGGISLPAGMTYADYAHRGAYPLMGAAVLAGGFALIAQPHLERPALRHLLYVWVAQTVLLTLSSILRLDLYVEAYGLTRLRFFAFVWMGVVALGLVLILMQMWGRQSTGWFLLRASGLAVLTIYILSLINVDGLVARNLKLRGETAHYYMCSLGAGAAVATRGICDSPGRKLTTPKDWREWGYRNARLRNSLTWMTVEVQP